jgi:hypothetical protein
LRKRAVQSDGRCIGRAGAQAADQRNNNGRSMPPTWEVHLASGTQSAGVTQKVALPNALSITLEPRCA